jgi:hypothetical protein
MSSYIQHGPFALPKASPGAAIFGQDMLFDVLFIADWKKMENIGNN